MNNMIFAVISVQLFISLLIPVFVEAQTDNNPVVIQYGDTTMDRREFELEFEMVMVLKAVENSEPIKSQSQIYLMQQRYLEQRAREMVLSDLAAQRGITVSDSQLDDMLDEYMKSLGFPGYSMKNMQKLGFANEKPIRKLLQRREIISRVLAEINTELKAGNNKAILEAELDTLYMESGIRVFPEHLQRTFMH